MNERNGNHITWKALGIALITIIGSIIIFTFGNFRSDVKEDVKTVQIELGSAKNALADNWQRIIKVETETENLKIDISDMKEKIDKIYDFLLKQQGVTPLKKP